LNVQLRDKVDTLEQITRDLESALDKQKSRLRAMRTELQLMNTIKAFGSAFPRLREPLVDHPPPDSPFSTDTLGPPGFGNVFGVRLLLALAAY
jgi:hypothetical protein